MRNTIKCESIYLQIPFLRGEKKKAPLILTLSYVFKTSYYWLYMTNDFRSKASYLYIHIFVNTCLSGYRVILKRESNERRESIERNQFVPVSFSFLFFGFFLNILLLNISENQRKWYWNWSFININTFL